MAANTIRNTEPIAAINVTPLVDVMLVLLIIFMITAPMMTQRLLLNLPQKVPHEVKPTEPLSLHIRFDGGVVLDGSELPVALLDAEFAHLASLHEPPALQIEVDENTQYHHVIDVLASLKANGLKRISFVDSNS